MDAAHPPAPAFRHLKHRLHDPEQFGIAVSGAHLTMDFLSRQETPARIEQFQSPAWALDFYQTQVKARVYAPLPPGWASIGLMRSAAPSSWYGSQARQGALVCNQPGEPIDGCITPGFDCLAVSVPHELWEQGRALAGIERSTFGSCAVFHLPPALYARAEHQLQSAHRLLRAASTSPHLAALAAREAASFATLLVTTAWEVSATTAHPRDSYRNRARLARRAEAWMRENLAQSVQIPEVCLALRVSRRELEYAFRLTFDQSPRDFLQALRLNAIRRVLAETESTIIEVAFDHGLNHPGRFAAHYRAIFGETPSQTRQRRHTNR